MSSNIVEYLRKLSVENLFTTNTFSEAWDVWKNEINRYASNKTPNQILNLGDNLANIFRSTSSGGRTQSDVSAGGNAWESLTCWYLNLCLIGRRTVVIKHHKELIPSPISDAITVNYSNFVSNTESDLIAITFPDEKEYCQDISEIEIEDINGNKVQVYNGTKINCKEIMNALCTRDFPKIEVHIIQCKTNWNDNAQIPMLWNMVYSAQDFRESNISIGRNGYSIHDIKKFTYSFVTVPTVRLEAFKTNSTAVKRVINLSGGNYWGYPTKSGIANSIKEMLSRNLASGASNNHLNTLRQELEQLNSKYNYFKINNA